MSLRRTSETSADGLAAKSLPCKLPANSHRHLEHEVDLEGVVDFSDFRFSGLYGGCGFRWSSWWLSVPEG